MHPSFHIQRRVEFCETDAAGIAHFSAFFLYMEQAEHALLRHLGLSVFGHDDEGTITWPRASAHCDYTGPVKFEDLLDVAVSVKRIGSKSVTYAFEFTLSGRRVAVGSLTAVCCRLAGDEQARSIPIPTWIAQRLQTYVAVPSD